MSYKLLILILSSDTYPSRRNKKIINNTWVQKTPINTEIYYYKAGKLNELKNGNEISLKVGKSSLDISKKNILAFRWALENLEFDYLFRTTTTSYVNIKLLNKYIVDNFLNKNYVYAGKIMETNDLQSNLCSYVNGSGILFNRKTIEEIILNEKMMDFAEWDDVGIGKLLSQCGIKPQSGKRYDIKGNIFKQKLDLNSYHYRCRIDNHYGYPRFLEVYVIKYLHKFINNIKINSLTKSLYNFIFEIGKILYIQYPFWKLYLFIKNLIKLILPKKLFNFIKVKLENLIKNFQLRYFKY